MFAGLTPDNPGYIPLVVWAETYWVLTRSYAFSPASAAATLEELLASDEVTAQAESQVRWALGEAAGGADLADALILAAAREAGCVESATFDAKASARLGYRLLAPDPE
ncbi:MAG: PIN domain-containing protein [Bifidobacteriaceae bacterium]|jgi:predicted nucleic-acid-binding protein|nr:PIN domain-containing protein [Bifidobacteriaceae bacterium]